MEIKQAKNRLKTGLKQAKNGLKTGQKQHEKGDKTDISAHKKPGKADISVHKKSRKADTKMLALMGVFVALIIVGAFIKIPTPLMPVTLQAAFCLLAGMLLGGGRGACCVLIYVIMGLIGIPVFTAGGGVSYVLQPSFGFLIGEIFAAFVAGKLARVSFKGAKKHKLSYANTQNCTLSDGNIVENTSNNTISSKNAQNSITSDENTAGVSSSENNTENTAYISGNMLSQRTVGMKAAQFFQIFGASIAGLTVMYMIGLPYMYVMKNVYLGAAMSVKTVFTFGCAVFLPTDTLWCILASILTFKLMPRLQKPKITAQECVYERQAK